MGIFSRLTDIVNSNISALLDKAEDPEKLVRLIIQEMEETLVEVRTTAARAIADRKELTRRLERLQSDAAEWERKAEVAIGKGREDLARAALLEKGKVTELCASIEQEVADLDESVDKLSGDIGALQQKIKDARARQKSIIMRGRAAKGRVGVRRHLADHNIDDAMERFDEYERRMDDLEGEAEAYDLGQRSLAEEIADLEADDAVNAELERLKRRMSQPAPGGDATGGQG